MIHSSLSIHVVIDVIDPFAKNLLVRVLLVIGQQRWLSREQPLDHHDRPQEPSPDTLPLQVVLALERDDDPDAQESERHDRRDVVRYGAFRSRVDLFDVHTEYALRRITCAGVRRESVRRTEKDVLTATNDAGRKIIVK